MKIQLLIVPYDSALYNVRMGAGPQYLLTHGLVEHLLKSGHQLQIHTLEVDKELFPAEIATAFHLQRLLAQQVQQACLQERLPVILAGNCNTAIGIVAGLHSSTLGVCWFDCHGDFNTPETTTGGFLDGMALAMLTGRCWNQLTRSVANFQPVEDNRIALIGTRDLDPLEQQLLMASDISLFSPQVLRKDPTLLLSHFPPSVQAVYIHLDLDVIDPSFGRANTFATPGGLTIEEIVEML